MPPRGLEGIDAIEREIQDDPEVVQARAKITTSAPQWCRPAGTAPPRAPARAGFDADEDLARLRAYADTIDRRDC